MLLVRGKNLARQMVKSGASVAECSVTRPKNMRSSEQDSSTTSRSKKTTGHGGISSHAGTDNTSTTASLPSVVCVNTEDVAFMATVTRVIRDTIFPRKQFIILESEMDVNGKLASKCLRALHLDRSQWHLIKEIIRKQLSRRRNNAHLGVRLCLEGEL